MCPDVRISGGGEVLEDGVATTCLKVTGKADQIALFVEELKDTIRRTRSDRILKIDRRGKEICFIEIIEKQHKKGS